jgi:hypothetical protein
MKNNNIKRFFRQSLPILVVSLLFVSCFEKYHELELADYEPKLVVNSFFNVGEPIKVSISGSLSRTNTGKFLPVVDAKVDLYEEETWKEELKGGPNNDGRIWLDSIGTWFYYSQSILPQPGKKYRIEVSAPGFKSVTAESMVPGSSALQILDTIVINRDIKNNTGDYILRVSLKMENMIKQRWYYLNAAYLNAITEWDGINPEKIVGYRKSHFPVRVNDPLIGLREGRVKEDYLLFNNPLAPDEKYQFYVNLMFRSIHGPHVSLNLVTLSDEAYNYFESVSDFKNNEPAYSEPVKLYSNVEGGFGIFAAINIASDTIWRIQYPEGMWGKK